jgi:hypothetical protein
MLLAFLQKFHRMTASCCQSCVWGSSGLLKACELFKEKLLFCSRISAAKKNKSQYILSTGCAISVFSHASEWLLDGSSSIRRCFIEQNYGIVLAC